MNTVSSAVQKCPPGCASLENVNSKNQLFYGDHTATHCDHVLYLREGNAKGHSSDDSHVALYEGRHQLITTLQTHLIHSYMTKWITVSIFDLIKQPYLKPRIKHSFILKLRLHRVCLWPVCGLCVQPELRSLDRQICSRRNWCSSWGEPHWLENTRCWTSWCSYELRSSVTTRQTRNVGGNVSRQSVALWYLLMLRANTNRKHCIVSI